MKTKLRRVRKKSKEAVIGNRMAENTLKRLKNSLNRTGMNQSLYLLFFSVMMTVKMAGFYEGQFVFNAALIFGTVLLAIKVVLDKYTVREYALAALLILLGGIVYLKTGEKGLLICFATMLGMKGVSVKKVFVSGVVCSGIVLAIKIIGGAFGIIPEKYFISYREGVGVELRHSFGYAHPNTMQISTLVLGMMLLYLITKYTTHIILGSLFVFLMNLFIYQYSGSRTGMMVCIIYIFVNIWFFYAKKMGALEKMMCYLAYPIACSVSLLAPLFVTQGYNSRIDALLFSYRLSISRYYYDNNPLSLFGIRLNNPDANVFSLDMAYLYLFLQLGVVTFVIISWLTLFCVRMAALGNKSAELALFIGITVAGIWEPFLYNSSFKNVLFVFAGAVLYGQIENNAVQKIISFSRRQVIAGVIAAALVGAMAVGIYLFQTTEPTSIYVNADPPEIVKQDGIVPIYLTKSEKDDILESGGFVLSYIDEQTPMYEYGHKMAHDEYRNRIFSVAVLGCLFGIVGYCIWNRYSRS